MCTHPLYISLGPCPHSGLMTSLDCNTNTAVVSWMPGSGILYYSASADAFDIDHMQTCSSNGSSCNISSLRCGESYRVSVSGMGLICPSPAQDWRRVDTGNFIKIPDTSTTIYQITFSKVIVLNIYPSPLVCLSRLFQVYPLLWPTFIFL